MLPHPAQVHHSLSIQFPQLWQSQPIGPFGFSAAALSMIFRLSSADFLFVNGLFFFGVGVCPCCCEGGGIFGDEGGVGRSVLQASQQR